MKAIEDRLRERIGFDVRALGRPTLERVVLARMQRAGVDTVDEYVRILRRSPDEWSDLVESVVVPETWFFRDAEAFRGLTQFLNEEWLPGRPGRCLRILSLPCSSGEEPYSIAMALLDEGLSPERFRVDAIDISARALGRAQVGVYGKNAFRGRDLSFRARYFSRTKSGYVLSEVVKQCVRFAQGNLLSEDVLQRLGQPLAGTIGEQVQSFRGVVAGGGGDEQSDYDCIFCRNLLIYFDKAGQAAALARLRRFLDPRGILVVGPAEQGVAFNCGFIPAGVAMGFRWASAGAPVEKRSRVDRPEPGAGTARPRSFVSENGDEPSPPRTQPDPTPQTCPGWSSLPPRLFEQPDQRKQDTTAGAAITLTQAKQLADAGRYEEARLLCQSFLELHPDSADAYYLLGLIRDTIGHGNSAECYRRALYLDPQHEQVIAHLVLSAERNGDYRQAENLRQRAQRCAKPGGI